MVTTIVYGLIGSSRTKKFKRGIERDKRDEELEWHEKCYIVFYGNHQGSFQLMIDYCSIVAIAEVKFNR